MRLPVRLPPLRVEDYKSRENVTQSPELAPSAVIVLAWRPRPPRTRSRGPFPPCTCPSSANCFSLWCSHQQDPEARQQSSNKLWVVPKVLQACTTIRCQWSLPNSDEHQPPLTTAKVCDLLQRCVLEAEPSSYGPCGHAQGFRNPPLGSDEGIPRGILSECFPLVYASDCRSIHRRQTEGRV